MASQMLLKKCWDGGDIESVRDFDELLYLGRYNDMDRSFGSYFGL